MKNLILKIAKIGNDRESADKPELYNVEFFNDYFDENESLKHDELDMMDGEFTRRELLTRYLLLNAVLDQGPDIPGVRLLLQLTTNQLYNNDIRIFHNPLDFFKYLPHVIEIIRKMHDRVRDIRAQKWARDNKSKASKYNLMFAQSMRGLISINQVLDYSLHRWGVPLCVPYMLMNTQKQEKKQTTLLEEDNNHALYQPLVKYIENFKSAENASQQLKENKIYGLGSAIGNKACHLMMKWYIHTFKLVTKSEPGWSKWAYEVPFDSNIGRVLFRSGILLKLQDIEKYSQWDVIQENNGKKGNHYIRVTNIRSKKAKDEINKKFKDKNIKIVKDYLQTKIRPRKIEIQHIANIILLGSDYGVGDFDDGLIYIGREFCHNHAKPKCEDCPISQYCYSFQHQPDLIKKYNT